MKADLPDIHEQFVECVRADVEKIALEMKRKVLASIAEGKYVDLSGGYWKQND